ncbi:hypothetical protein DUNSADRAFT_17469 [Dunaliella salina]|uniref:Encoded protein n=1 Tax=Dunaliella salina TaxID=3046 RepID=A0ABQ7G1Q3_DUNSA|nr:hypothetical protein DUNSADRAFT_17469 [Dunaliella salina]|eukprot:KAF5828539.1 hypothetical protein DUNSADRAFT_17469 [Dunaliella salina]
MFRQLKLYINETQNRKARPVTWLLLVCLSPRMNLHYNEFALRTCCEDKFTQDLSEKACLLPLLLAC